MSPAHRKAQGAAEPAVTVAVATYRRAHLLPRLLAALEAQTIGVVGFEVVIVDDASGDDTPRTLAALVAASPLSLRWSTSVRNGGPAVSRNIAWRQATAPVVAFTDDDCVPSSRWLEELLRASLPGVVVVGRTVPAEDQLQQEGPFSRTLRVDDESLMQTCNVAYRREDIERLGGFDERMRTGEDTDLGLRALAAGIEPVFAADAVVEHDVRPSSFPAAWREARSWVDLPLVVKRHPQVRARLLHRRVFWKPSHPRVLLAVAAPLVSRTHPAGWLLVLPWLSWRLREQPLAASSRERWATLPGAFAVDATEVVTMVRGSVKHRTFLL